MPSKQFFDIISDLHGDIPRLTGLMTALNRDEDCGGPEGVKLLFLGDYIDRGTDGLAVLQRVEKVIVREQAYGLMGNHELNALLFASEGYASAGGPRGYMRAHSPANIHQHKAFIDEVGFDTKAHQKALSFMLELPLFLEFEGLRAVHACWDQRAVDLVRARRPDGRLSREDLQEIALEETDFAKAVVTLCKGPELTLPAGFTYKDKSGKARDKCRLAWWKMPSDDWADIATSLPADSRLPSGPADLSGLDLAYGSSEVPVVFGHYQLTEMPEMGNNTLCLDLPDMPVAYRWTGERLFLDDGLTPIMSSHEICAEPDTM